MNRSVLCVCVLFASIDSYAQKQPEKLKMPGPDVQNLMLGKWSTQMKYAPSPEMPNGGTGEGTEIWRPGPGGLSVIEEYHEKNDNGEVEGLGVAWWDAKAQGQRFVWCENTNPDGCYVSKEVGKWEDGSLVWIEEQENAGKKRVYSEAFRDITPTSFTQVLGEGEPASALTTTVTIRATKVTESANNSEAAKLVALTNEWTDAINTRDRQKLDALMASDFALYHWNGELGAPRLQWLDNLFNHIKIQKNTLTNAAPQIYGDFGVVTSVGDWIGTFDGKPFASKCVVVDTWRKIDSQWKVVRRTSHCYTEDSGGVKVNWDF
jgi:ketosteroid isomerase-like protein